MIKRIPYVWFVGLALALAACSGERELYSPVDVGTLGVNAVLYVDETLPTVILYRAQSPEKPFDTFLAAERGATVVIRTAGTSTDYVEARPGIYRVPGGGPWVTPETTYHLEVTTTAGERLTATTTTPPRLSVSDWVILDDEATAVQRRLKTFAEVGDSVFTAPENQLVYTEGLLEAWLDPVTAAGYQAGIYALEPDSGFVIDPAFLDDEDFEDFEPNVASPPIRNSETKIRLPWFAIYYKGRYKIKIFALDRNWYDLARTVPELAGGGGAFGGNTGDDFERPIFHVDGGIGIFGSVSMDSVGFTIHPRP
jgi:hypothetical protein